MTSRPLPYSSTSPYSYSRTATPKGPCDILYLQRASKPGSRATNPLHARRPRHPAASKLHHRIRPQGPARGGAHRLIGAACGPHQKQETWKSPLAPTAGPAEVVSRRRSLTSTRSQWIKTISAWISSRCRWSWSLRMSGADHHPSGCRILSARRANELSEFRSHEEIVSNLLLINSIIQHEQDGELMA